VNVEPETLNVELFTGDANQAEARVYASISRAGLPPDARLTGELVGPACHYAKTLPARIRFVDRGPGETLLAEAIVPDPCFWTPDLPFMYTAELRMETRERIPARSVSEEPNTLNRIAPRAFGIRRLGVQRNSIYLDAKRFVLRGVRRDAAEICNLPAARDSASALYISDPSDDFLRGASKTGVLLAVDLTVRNLDVLAELVRLARWPAVAVVVLDDAASTASQMCAAARNSLLAQRITARTTDVQSWARIAWCEIGSSGAVPPTLRDLPIIVYRPAAQNTTIEEARRQCDRLQADLADLGDFAGYFT
jgi:hypothetical protein